MRARLTVLWLLFLGLLPVLGSEAAIEAEAAVEVGMTHRMMLLVIQLGLILFAAKLGNIVFERLHASPSNGVEECSTAPVYRSLPVAPSHPRLSMNGASLG